MLPVIEIFSIELSTYGIFTAIGLILMALGAIRLSARYGIRIEDIIFGEITALIGGALGAHLLYGVTKLEYLAKGIAAWYSHRESFEYLWKILCVAFGGMVYYGGLLFALGFGVLYCRIRRINTKNFADCFAVVIPLFHAFGRVGCFLSGCCYGIESSFGFTAVDALVDSCNNVNRFPVQLLESALNMCLFALLLLLFRKRNFEGVMIYVYLFLYSIIRFFDEFLRGDALRGICLGLSTSQWISAVLFSVSLFVLIKHIKNRQKLEFVYRG